jgi:hypothetical protein
MEAVNLDAAAAAHGEAAEKPHEPAPAPPPAPPPAGQPQAAAGTTDSAVDLGLPGHPTAAHPGDPAAPPPDLSGISSVEWSALVEEPPAKFDSPSDVDLIEKGLGEPTPPPRPKVTQVAGQQPPPTAGPAAGSSSEIDLGIDEPTTTPISDLSGVDLKALQKEIDAATSDLPPTPGSDVQLDISSEPPTLSDSSGVNLADLRAEDAAVPAELDEEAPVGKEPLRKSESSGVDLAGVSDVEVVLDSDHLDAVVLDEPVGGESPSSVVEAVLDESPSDSALRGNVVDALLDSGVDLAGNAIAREGNGDRIERATPDTSDSGRDLIAEAVESGTDLAPLVEDVEDAVLTDVESATQPAEESSAVDLGSSRPITEQVDLDEMDAILEPSSEHLVPPTEHPGGQARAEQMGSAHDLVPPAHPPSEIDLTEPAEVDLPGIDAAAAAEDDLLDTHAGPSSGELDLNKIEELAAPVSSGLLSDSGGVAEAPPEGVEDSALETAHLEEGHGPIAAEEEVEAEPEAEQEPEPGAEQEQPEEKPAKPLRRRGGLLVGTAAGALVGTAACLGLWVFGVEPPDSWRLASSSKPPTGPGTRPPTVTPPQPTITVAEALKSGDLTKAGELLTATPPVDDKPEQLLSRGQWRWESYLRTKALKGEKLNKRDLADENVKGALADLEKAAAANLPDAYVLLGDVYEQLNDFASARASYTKAAELFKEDQARKRQVDAAIKRLPLQVSAGPMRGGAVALALLLIALQQPEEPAPPPEAGFDFWEAVSLARQQKYAEAAQALDKARTQHDRRRFIFLRKPQNPDSDPREEIFLRSCDELKAYWQLQDRLRERGYLTAAQPNPVQAVDKLIESAAGGGAAIKIVADKLRVKKPEEVVPALDKLIADKDGAAQKAAELEKSLTQAQEDAKKNATALKNATDMVAARDKDLLAANDKLKKAAENNDALTKALGDANATLMKIGDALVEAKFVDPKPLPADVLRGLKNAINVAQLKEGAKEVQRLQVEVDRARKALEELTRERWQPAQMLAFWLPLLKERDRKDLTKNAAVDADRVLSDAAATPAQKARALVIRGLALRNAEKLAEARKALEQAKADLAGDDAAWRMEAEQALKEVEAPAVAYSARAEELASKGNYAGALDLLSRAIELVPEKKGRLLAQRSLIELDDLRSRVKGPLPGNDPSVASIRKDAEEAIKAGEPHGHYALGRLAEEMEQLDQAVQEYRKAIDATKDRPGEDVQRIRYQLALARVLLRPQERPAGARLDFKPLRIEDRAAAPEVAALLVSLALQPPPNAPNQEAVELLEKLLANKDLPFDVRAEAMARLGLWSAALSVYAEGLRPYLRRDQADLLLWLVKNHPRLSGPDARTVPNPLEAEKNYAAGLRYYNERRYSDAEKAFLGAVEQDGQDARYFYFLGLARWQQGKRSAYEDFEQGALLEQKNRPSRAAVSAALERVQGRARRDLNEVRDRPR